VPATIADVARRARVSTATVSRVLAGMGGARPETRDRILAAAHELEYRPSAVARSLRRGTTKSLGLIITDIENPFFPQLVRAVEDAAREQGYAVLLCNASDDPERESGYLDLLVERRVDGVIIAASSLGGRHREWLTDPPLPVVLVNSVARGVHLPSITSDNRLGGRLAAEHLLALGHRRLAVLTAGPRNADAPDRLAGVRRATHAAGIADRDLVVRMGEPDVRGGEAAATEVLEQCPDVTGIVAYNDLMAIGAMRAVRARGLDVPGQVSVIGFDDVPIAPYTDPPLTTIAQEIGALGAWAVARLVERLAADAGEALLGASGSGASGRPGAAGTAVAVGAVPAPVRAIVAVRLVERSSTGPVAAAVRG
jgi:DNA-binding LacI/PurR family transcriptional regulator